MLRKLAGGLVGLAFFAMAGTANAVPIELVFNGGFELATLTLFGAGLLGLGYARRRRRKTA